MQLEHILAAHGLIGRPGKGETPVPDISDFVATSRDDGSGIDLSWKNPDVTEYVRTEIFASTSNIQNASYEYCQQNATLIYNSTGEEHFIDGYPVGTTLYFRGFAVFLSFGETRISNGVGLSCTLIDIVPPGSITNFTATTDDQSVRLSWTNPADDDFDKVKIMYKEGGYPVSPIDGSVAYEGSGNNVTVTGLTNEVEYFFRAFTYDTHGNVNTSTEGQLLTATPSEQSIYGVRIDKNNSNPETRVTYIGDAVGFTPMRGNNGNFQWGSWKEVFEHFEIRPCVLQNKQVNYYLDPNDFTKRVDGSNANITGADGDVMIEFGKTLWWKWTDEGDTYTIEISDKPFSGAVKHAFEIEEGYNLVPYYPLLLTQILFVIFFKSTDSQTALGRGRVDNATGYASTGGTDKKGMFYGSTNDEQIKFLGIEDYWGNKFWWIDGLVTDTNYNLLIGKGNFNDNGSGYQTFTSGVSSNTSGYIDSVQGGNEKGFIIKSSGGSATTYYADYGALDSRRVARFGGDRSAGSSAGFAVLRLNYVGSDSFAYVGPRLFCASNGKIYIGAYLGTTQSGKLRSISGTPEPTGNKTIGTFRNEARANN